MLGVNCMVNLLDQPTAAIFIGLLQDERGETKAVIQFFGHGMYLDMVHPSKVVLFPGKTKEGQCCSKES